MSCPTCPGEPLITRGAVSVCAGCGETYTATGKATLADLEQIDAGDVQALRQQRARVFPHRKKSQGA